MNRAKSLQYVIALDFEATCEKVQGNIPDRETEIIEFPAVLMSLESGEIKSVFHRYVRPVEKPILSEFCVSLTGIKQSQVDTADELQKVMKDFDLWLTDNIRCYNLKFASKTTATCAFITWTDCDLAFFITSECKRKNIVVPEYFNRWINIKRILLNVNNIRDSKNFKFDNALILMDMSFNGQQHSGLDDARNLAMLTHKMVQKGLNLKWNCKHY